MAAIKQVKVGSTNYDLTAKNGVFYIEGSGTVDTTNKVATWTGSHDDITAYYNGLTILYKLGVAASTTTTLNINSLGAVTVVRNATTALSTVYPVDSIILLVYTTDDGTAYWKAHEYDANTRNTVGDYRKNGTKLYFVGTTSSDSSTSSSYATSYTNSNIYVNTSNVLYSASGFQGDLTGDVTGNADTATTATKVGTSTVGSATQPVYINAGTPTATTYTLGASVPSGAKFTDTTYSQATSSALGLVKIGYTESGKNYPVELNSSGQMYVNVPWSNTTYSVATTSANGLMSSTDKTNLNTVVTHASNTENPHGVTKAQVGLGNVTNNAQMPIAGGTFTGKATAVSANTNVACLRNSVVQTSAAANVSSNYMIFRRK